MRMGELLLVSALLEATKKRCQARDRFATQKSQEWVSEWVRRAELERHSVCTQSCHTAEYTAILAINFFPPRIIEKCINSVSKFLGSEVILSTCIYLLWDLATLLARSPLTKGGGREGVRVREEVNETFFPPPVGAPPGAIRACRVKWMKEGGGEEAEPEMVFNYRHEILLPLFFRGILWRSVR